MTTKEFYTMVLRLRNLVKKSRLIADKNERQKLFIQMECINRQIDKELESFFQSSLNL